VSPTTTAPTETIPTTTPDETTTTEVGTTTVQQPGPTGPTTTLPQTGGGSAGMMAGLGIGALLLGGLAMAIAGRRLRSNGGRPDVTSVH
jgi:LPXTG-motif cell wall-anchored protein